MTTVNRPGRPREHDPETVVAGALDIFWRQGVHDTTTRDLEAALGVSQSSLYNSYGSKRGLLQASLDRYEDMIDEALLRPLETARPGADAIDRFLVDLHRWITTDGRHGCMLMNLFAEEGGASEPIRQHAERYRERLRIAFRTALAHGELSGRGTQTRADQLVLAVLGLNLAARCRAPESELDALLAASRALVASWRAR